jgi:hypothetical protein
VVRKNHLHSQTRLSHHIGFPSPNRPEYETHMYLVLTNNIAN